MVNIAAWSTAGEAYRILYRNRGEFLLRSGGWIACVVGGLVVKMLPWPDAISLLLRLLTIVLISVAFGVFSVSWCRVILQDERSSGVVTLALGRREVRYIAYQSAVALIPGVPAALLFLVVGADTWWATGFSFLRGGPFHPLSFLSFVGSLVALLAMFVAGITVSARLMILLPAAAMDKPGQLLREAWRQTEADASPLFQGWLACILPPTVLWAIPSFYVEHLLGSLASPIMELMAYPLCFVALALTAGFYSYAFAQLVEGRPVSDEHVPPAVAGPPEVRAASPSDFAPINAERLARRVSSILRKSDNSTKPGKFNAFRW